MCDPSMGSGLETLLIEDTVVRENARLACEAVHLKLVKLANSAFYGGRHPVGTIRQALMALGTTTVRRWAALLALAGVNDRPSHLLETGLLRARLCELVAARTSGAEAAGGGQDRQFWARWLTPSL